MQEFQYSHKQYFFEPVFQELACFRKYSNNSMNDWNIVEDQKQYDLELVIEDVSLQIENLDEKDSLSNFQFDLTRTPYAQDDSSGEQQNIISLPQKSIKSLQSKPQSKTDLSKIKKIFKGKTKFKKSSKHKLTLGKLCYEKNICRNIIRKAIRAIQCSHYQIQLLYICNSNVDFYKQFKQIIVDNVQSITGPRALQAFLQPKDDISKVFRKFLIWYLKQKYLREALQSGQMDNVEKYIEYKNQILLPLLKSI